MSSDPFALSTVVPFSEGNDSSAPERLFAAYSSTAGLCILDPEYRYVWINHKFAEMNGKTASEHFGKTVRDIVGDLADVIEPYLRRAFATNQPILNVELSAIHPVQETAFHWTQYFFPLKDAEGELTRIGMVVAEIAEKKTLQNAVQDLDGKLRKQMERLQAMLDVSGLLSSNWDVPLVFPMVSAHLRRLLHHELASFVLYNPESHELQRHAVDFPLSKGLLSTTPISAKNTPAERALQAHDDYLLQGGIAGL
jgi:PAS domain-containing protein